MPSSSNTRRPAGDPTAPVLNITNLWSRYCLGESVELLAIRLRTTERVIRSRLKLAAKLTLAGRRLRTYGTGYGPGRYRPHPRRADGEDEVSA